MTYEFNHAESVALAKQLRALFKHWQLSPGAAACRPGAWRIGTCDTDRN